MKLDHAEWCRRYAALRTVADRIYKQRRELVNDMLKEVGMYPYHGCCIHNCSISTAGNGGWGGSYADGPDEIAKAKQRIRVCKRIKEIEHAHEVDEIIRKWDAAHR